MSFEENFLYPLYLLLIGGAITGGLIPAFNRLAQKRQREIEILRHEKQLDIDRKREDRHKSLEIKADLVRTISEIYGISVDIMYRTSVDIQEGKKTTQSLLTPELKNKLFKDRTVARSLVTAYFNKKKIDLDFAFYDQVLGALMFLFDGTDTGLHLNKDDLQVLKDYFKGKIDVNWDELNQGKNAVESWNKISSIIGSIKDNIILQIFNEKITVFGKK